MKKIKFLFGLLVIAICSIVYVSCQNVSDEPVKATYGRFIGEDNYKSTLVSLSKRTRMGDANSTPSKEDVEELINASRIFLIENDITCEELGISENDELVSIVAMAMLDYEKVYLNNTRTTAGGCVIEALSVKEVVTALEKEQPSMWQKL